MRPYLLLILICSAILTGCHSEQKDFVRRNKPRIDVKIAALFERVDNFIRQEEDLEYDELKTQSYNLLKELDSLEWEHELNFWKAQYLGVDRELYLHDPNSDSFPFPDEASEMHTAIRESAERLMNLVGLRVRSPYEFVTFLEQDGVCWDNLWPSGYRLSELFDDRFGDDPNYDSEKTKSQILKQFEKSEQIQSQRAEIISKWRRNL